MRVIASEPSRVTILFPLEEVVPLGGANGRDIIEKTKQRYEFLNSPNPGTPREELAKSGYKFETGQFDFKGNKINIFDFAIYTDGIVANAGTTERAEAFVDDVLQWARTEFGFRNFSTKQKCYYISQLVVEFDKPLAKLIPLFEKIATAISRRIDPIYQISAPMNLARLDFEIDKTVILTTVPKFFIERRLGIPFDKERYFAGAPMQTADHIAVLEEIEKLCS